MISPEEKCFRLFDITRRQNISSLMFGENKLMKCVLITFFLVTADRFNLILILFMKPKLISRFVTQ